MNVLMIHRIISNNFTYFRQGYNKLCKVCITASPFFFYIFKKFFEFTITSSISTIHSQLLVIINIISFWTTNKWSKPTHAQTDHIMLHVSTSWKYSRIEEIIQSSPWWISWSCLPSSWYLNTLYQVLFGVPLQGSFRYFHCSNINLVIPLALTTSKYEYVTSKIFYARTCITHSVFFEIFNSRGFNHPIVIWRLQFCHRDS